MREPEYVSVSFIGGTALVTVCNPPVNATSASVRAGLSQAVETVIAAKADAAILICTGSTFIAGGDLSEFDAPPREPHLPDVINAIENSPVPWIAAMHGTVLGGGFEIAMGCAFRIAAPGTRFGLPEVKVGLIPGAGGTQRLPRLIGTEAALDMCCSGALRPVEDMVALGAVDRIAEGDLLTAVRAFAAENHPRAIPVSQRAADARSRQYLARQREEITNRAKGQNAPLHNLEAVAWAAETDFTTGLARERRLHLEMRGGAQSKALRHVFFAERAVAKPDAIKGVTVRDISHVVIVGGGLMGAGIAAACLLAGLTVTMIERDTDATEAGAQRIISILDGARKRDKITETQHASHLKRLTTGTDYSSAAAADLAIEAVFEDLDVKREVFRSLAAVMRPDAILATNTSYLDPRQIIAGIKAPERCLGLHFFSPAHIMKFLEVVKTPETAPEVVASGFALAKRLRKIAVLAGICDGFIGNRMLAAYRRQADYLLADGCLPWQIDDAMRGFGMPMGPYELQDLTGLQIAWANRRRLADTREPAIRYVAIADRLCEAGRLGQRSGKGWYVYEANDRKPLRDDDVEALIIEWSADHNIARRDFSSSEITGLMIAALVNEGARIVEEGIAERALDVDMVQVHAYGFPRWRGGPMHYAEQIGIDEVSKRMKDVAAQSPGSWTISDLLD